jgi:hypothetical protein
MSFLIFILLLSVILVVINSSTVLALNASNNKPDASSFGGLSAESTDIAEAGNRTDSINDTNNNSGTDFGGLSARSVNITK